MKSKESSIVFQEKTKNTVKAFYIVLDFFVHRVQKLREIRLQDRY